MKTFKQYSNYALMSTLFVFTLFAAGCGGSDTAATVSPTPIVVSTTPISGATSVSLNTNITAFFDKELDTSTVNATTFTLKSGTTEVNGTVSYANKAMIFNPTDENLSINTLYIATVTIRVKDSTSNALSAYVWNFTTGTTADSTAPKVTSTYPTDITTKVPINTGVSALFSEPLNPSTVNTTTFSLAQGVTPIPGVVSYSGKTIVFNPTADLKITTKYTATITTGVTDLADNALAADKVWTFTTGATVASVLAPVDLGTAGDFVILAKTGVSTTGTTTITGDIGVSPAALTYITGFSQTNDSTNTFATSPIVTGKIYAANMTPPTPAKMTTAVSDMETAYTASTAVASDYTELYAGDVSGKILTPGVYKWSTGVLITDVGVTIRGSATDVWIFQMAGDLTVSNGAHITLAGGALAKNIFWQVAGGAGAIIGTTADFKGVVLAQTAISVKTGARVNGRLLAQSAVTLDANAVTQP